jgi:hypothetical protein
MTSFLSTNICRSICGVLWHHYDIIPCRYNFVRYLVGQSILIEKK